MPTLPVLIDDAADRGRVKPARHAIQDDLRDGRLTFVGFAAGFEIDGFGQATVFPRRFVLVEERRVIWPSPTSAGTSPMAGAAPRARLERATTSMGVESAGAGVVDPSATARLVAGVAPCISRSLIAAGRIVIGECSWPGDAAALECAVVGLSPSGHGSKAVALSEGGGLAVRNRETARRPVFVMMENQIFGTEFGEAMGLAQPRVECRPQTSQGVSLMGAVDRRKQVRVAFQNGARFDFIGQAANSSSLQSTDLPPARSFAASPGNPPKSMEAQSAAPRVLLGTKTAGGAGGRKATGRDHDAPEEASWPASALIETASAMPRHHGATTPIAQPIRE